LFAEERYKRIVETVNAAGKVTVAELSRALGVTPVTVRRDLEKLEANNLLVRTHGGAISIGSDVVGTGVERSFAEKEEALAEEKERIAKAAAERVRDHETVLLSPGTTNMRLARCLVGKKRLTLVTNAVNIAMYMLANSEHDVMLLGGSMRRKSLASVGPMTEDSLRHIRVDKLFLGVDGLDVREGLTTPNMGEAAVNRRMIDIAREVIVVADHSKFGKVTFSRIAPIESVDVVISDKGLSEDHVNALRDAGVKILLV
jgi:DeoR/GlpR family transcriptional regulator of sugar metabolism